LCTCTVVIVPSFSTENLDSLPPGVASSSTGHVTTADHVTAMVDELNATTPTLRFRLAADSFYEWIADGGGGGDVSRRVMGDQSPVARFWENWLERNWTILPNATSDDDYDALLEALGGHQSSPTVAASGAVSNVRRTDVEVSWMYWTKTVVQLTSSSLVGFTVHRRVVILYRHAVK